MIHLSLLLMRLGLGSIFFAHGLRKLTSKGDSSNPLEPVNGVANVAVYFRKVGVPFPEIAAYLATYGEMIAGVALIIGAFTAVVGLLLTADMLAALFLVHIENGLFIDNGGFELVLALALGTLTLAVLGAGRYSADEYLYPRIGRAAALDGI